MIIKVLIAQRKERYIGEHGPEVLDAVGDFDYDENPEYIEEKLKKEKANTEWESVALIDININEDDVMAILRPTQNAIVGEVLKPEGEFADAPSFPQSENPVSAKPCELK